MSATDFRTILKDWRANAEGPGASGRDEEGPTPRTDCIVPAQQLSGTQAEGFEPALFPGPVMVCMSSNAFAPRVLRTGARIAGRLGSRWYAVYVETPRERADRINPRDADALHQNIKLAETLGATLVRVKADEPADGLIAFAQREGLTYVIFGQSARTRWELLLRGSTLDKFMGAVPAAAVQVVPLNES